MLDKPKILLKPKEEKPQPVPVQISIASRPVADRDNAASQDPKSFSSTTQKSLTAASTVSSSQEAKDGPTSEATLAPMKRPATIITDYYQVNNQALDYVIETNAAFFVVGIIGTQGVGKSTILNLLGAKRWNRDNIEELLVNPANPIFKARTTHETIFSNMPVTEGVQMYITSDRTILLDCSPVLCNPYKKDIVINEIDDMKLLMFLLTVCHTLIVVEEGTSLNLPLIRLIQSAEKMKLDYDRETNDFYTPNVVFVKNKCINSDFLAGKRDNVDLLYKYLFKHSKLKIGTDIYFDSSITDAKSLKNRKVNVVYLPLIDTTRKLLYMSIPHSNRILNKLKILSENALYQGHPDLKLILDDFKQRVFMSSRPVFRSLANPQAPFTEKSWSHLVLGVWDSHKNNYFLRKYENFKEKEWPIRV